MPSVNEVVPRGKAVETAITWARRICENSPEAVQATKHGLMLSLLRGGVEDAFASHVWSEASKKVWAGENIKVSRVYNDPIPRCLSHPQEGLRAFVEVRVCPPSEVRSLTIRQKRKPAWGNPSAKL
jgi:hypothetical protein